MNSLIYGKAFNFSVKIVELYRYLCDGKKEYIISKQVVRAGTSIAANIKEGLYGQSRKDFLSKMSISLKEAVETKYWLELAMSAHIAEKNKIDFLINDCDELIRILTSIIKTTKKQIV